MRRSLVVCLSLLGLLGAYACGNDGGKPKKIPPVGETGGRLPGSGGTDNESAGAAGDTPGGASNGGSGDVNNGGSGDENTGGAGDIGAGGEAKPGAPQVTLTSPPATETAQDGTVIVEDDIEVLCEAIESPQPGSHPVASVTIQLLADDEVVSEQSAEATDNPDEYAATFPVQTLESGPISFVCLAQDTSKPALEGSDQIDTFVDRGPTIDVDEPVADRPLPLRQPAHFEFSVAPDPLESPDPQAEVEDVQLHVAGVDVQRCADVSAGPCFEEAEDSSGTYAADIDFSDTLYFSPTPETVQVTISATNQRSPDAATRTHSLTFPLDGEGPVVTFLSPKPGSVHSGKVTLSFSVVDDSGIDVDTLELEVAGESFDYPADGEWVRNGDTFNFAFDTVDLDPILSDITIRVLVEDAVGNEVDGGGATITLTVDNVPPIVDLDAPLVRDYKWLKQSDGTLKCSVPFDPLTQFAYGDTSPSDGDVRLGKLGSTFRVLAWDETNRAPGDPFATYAGVDAGTVDLYVQTAAQAQVAPLIIDSNDDGICDEIDNSQAVVQNMSRISPQGGGLYPGDAHLADDPVATDLCTDHTATATDPTFLCSGDSPDMYYVMKHVHLDESVIYGVPPLTGDACKGNGWLVVPDVGDDGWLCFAGRAVDNVGNVGISRPLRVCFEDPDNPGGADCSEDAMPSCAANCTLPRDFEYVRIDRT